MRRIILIIFLFSIFLYSNDFDIEVNENLETKLKASIFDDDMNFTKLSINGYIHIFSKTLNKEFKLKVVNSLVIKGIIPLSDDWKFKKNNFKFSNIPYKTSLIGYGNYMGEENKKKKEEHICSNEKLSIKNITKDKKLFIIAINTSTKKFYKQYYGNFKEIITFDKCIENNTYIVKRKLFNIDYEVKK